ncbi:uncharacterized protein LOC18427187 [Amborella trichopoda]|uniref:DUF632 domain-containing protein n=1 Tax=Amborella trichopoda TaxID=13333 RepID=W1NVA3_AMBTC|nr:uncharacterized protein LOC18427187 [Amborella trichopoda]XP_020518682.1 uncharacterized protein LOC18427187 [Amborella trichopoda]ERM99160.1 hypothetical protein AMTR_s00092p00040150 [Amborella trichopoda]|eukprot:XP_020518681.1 uncharacterized protein LOC18427187 [Amborella trichopoda]
MGCASSRVDKEENVQRCKERRRLIKQAVACRNEFSNSLMAYLQALRNTGVTLRQFAEAESMELNSLTPSFMPPPPPPLPPSPPPALPLSPLQRSSSPGTISSDFTAKTIVTIGENNSKNTDVNNTDSNKVCQESMDIDHGVDTPPPPPAQGSAWDFWDPFGSSLNPNPKKVPCLEDQKKEGNLTEDEVWAETNTEFEEDVFMESEVDLILNPIHEKSVAKEMEDNSSMVSFSKPLPEKSPAREMDDSSSMVSWYTKDTDLAMVVWRTKRSLMGIVKELDDYFLKASAGGKEAAVLLEISRSLSLHHGYERNKKSSFKSAKVFSALSWSWSSKNRDTVENFSFDGSFRHDSHCTTLDKLYVEEQRLYKEIKGEEIAKYQLKKKSGLLQRQEARNKDGVKIEKARLNVEGLQSQIQSSHLSIDSLLSSISRLREEELHPQLVELAAGLMHMWRTMYECHQVQNHIAQQLNHLDHPSSEPTTEHHRQAALQLEAELSSWYTSFCRLLESHRNYIRSISSYIRLRLPRERNPPINSGPDFLSLCKEWQLALDRLPYRPASEAIKSLVTVIRSIISQQKEERYQHKRSEKLAKCLERETRALSVMEEKFTARERNEHLRGLERETKTLLATEVATEESAAAAAELLPWGLDGETKALSITEELSSRERNELSGVLEGETKTVSATEEFDARERKKPSGGLERGALEAARERKEKPLLVKRAKVETLKKRAEEEKGKHENSVRVSRAMTLNNLQTALPNVFQAMMGFTSICTQAFEAINGHAKAGYQGADICEMYL